MRNDPDHPPESPGAFVPAQILATDRPFMSFEETHSHPPLPPWWGDTDGVSEWKPSSDPNRGWTAVRVVTVAVFLTIFIVLVILLV
ncbi:hypothetical protein [Nocardia brasiliensis]|uniref:hypothetical protein n=1 Tax=Nocardia brasiliensis TaxID=37326 RepID=UPI003D943F8C